MRRVFSTDAAVPVALVGFAATIVLVTCSVDDIDLIGRPCPCPVSLVCDEASGVCVEHLTSTVSAGGSSPSATSTLSTGAQLGSGGEGGNLPDGSDEADAPDEPEVTECLAPAAPCDPETSVCCNGLSCAMIQVPAENRCCGLVGDPCSHPQSEDCCGNWICTGGTCQF